MDTAQILGFSAMAVGFYGTSLKSDKQFMLCSALSGAIYLPHFLLLGSLSSAISILLGTTRIVAARYCQSQWLMIGFIALAALQACFVVEHWYQLLSIVAGIATTWAYFNLRQIRLRMALILVAPLWITEAICIDSVSTIIHTAVGVGIHFIAINKMNMTQPTSNQSLA